MRVCLEAAKVIETLSADVIWIALTELSTSYVIGLNIDTEDSLLFEAAGTKNDFLPLDQRL